MAISEWYTLFSILKVLFLPRETSMTHTHAHDQELWWDQSKVFVLSSPASSNIMRMHKKHKSRFLVMLQNNWESRSKSILLLNKG